MKPSRSITMLAAGLLVLGLVGAGTLMRRVDRLRPAATLEEVLYFPSSKAIRRMSLGYTGLMADIYWTRAVQYFGGKHYSGSRRYDLLAPFLDITTDLDPQLLVAYEFGASFLGNEGAHQPDKAVALVEKGIRNNPQSWRLYYALGFVHYMERKDYATAAQVFLQGSKVPNAHPWLGVLAAQTARKAGDIATSRMMWTATLDTTQDKWIRQNAARHLQALQADADVMELERLVDLFRQQKGHAPTSLRELMDAGMLLGIPRDPVGNPYVMKSGGRIEVRDPDKLPFLQKGLPPGYQPKTPPPTAVESK